jgi:hypothetical protein
MSGNTVKLLEAKIGLLLILRDLIGVPVGGTEEELLQAD